MKEITRITASDFAWKHKLLAIFTHVSGVYEALLPTEPGICNFSATRILQLIDKNEPSRVVPRAKIVFWLNAMTGKQRDALAYFLKTGEIP